MNDGVARGHDPRATLSLWEYRRRVADLYTAVRSLPAEEGWRRWRDGRDHLFGSHPQSAIPESRRASFEGLPCFPYDPALRVTAVVEPGDGSSVALPHSGDGGTAARAFGTVECPLPGGTARLTLYWLDQYGGGVFLPFVDATGGTETYGGGRYLLDTAKGADLGSGDDGVVLDFNFAYHPSCVHDSRWSCPLSPTANRVECEIRGGERLP
jgi:uncharacterized protein (DUF1684 family)